LLQVLSQAFDQGAKILTLRKGVNYCTNTAVDKMEKTKGIGPVLIDIVSGLGKQQCIKGE
jgi:hypothetical protein